jgi:hypothetical protein
VLGEVSNEHHGHHDHYGFCRLKRFSECGRNYSARHKLFFPTKPTQNLRHWPTPRNQPIWRMVEWHNLVILTNTTLSIVPDVRLILSMDQVNKPLVTNSTTKSSEDRVGLFLDRSLIVTCAFVEYNLHHPWCRVASSRIVTLPRGTTHPSDNSGCHRQSTKVGDQTAPRLRLSDSTKNVSETNDEINK